MIQICRLSIGKSFIINNQLYIVTNENASVPEGYWPAVKIPEGELTLLPNNTFVETVNVSYKISKENEIVSKNCNFFVVDVAKTVEGKWIVIELNDGQMSGLSMCDEKLLYQNLEMEIERDV